MLSPLSLILIALAYMALLFAIAWIGDKQRIARDHRKIQAGIYSLSLAVYCTSWTFYGAVGSAATTGWGYLPIYLGPALLFLLGFDLIRRIAVTSRDQRITSIADYIAYRYGRSHTIAVLVTLAAVIGSVPYIALQLKGITTGFDVIGRSTGVDAALLDDRLKRRVVPQIQGIHRLGIKVPVNQNGRSARGVKPSTIDDRVAACGHDPD